MKLDGSKKNSIIIILVVIALAAVVYFLKVGGVFERLSSQEQLQEYISGFGATAFIMFFIIQMISVIFAPIPNNLTAAAGGVLFGLWSSFFISLLAIICGSMVVFLLTQKFGRPFAERFVSARETRKYIKFIEQKTDVVLFLIFLLPFFPDDIMCILAGLTKITWQRFLIIISVARPMGILLSSAIGSASFSLPWWGWLIIGAATILIFALGLKYGVAIEEKIIEWVGGHIKKGKSRLQLQKKNKKAAR
jgi:uncharacterized membrane protein YdjX (TVP38/TMEM64 family)